VLTGRFISAEEALSYGLINKIVPVEMYLYEATQLAKEIAQMSPIAIQLAKEAVNRSFETHLAEGLLLERKNFYLAFASEDQKEGMKAFIEKRKPEFQDAHVCRTSHLFHIQCVGGTFCLLFTNPRLKSRGN